MIAPRTFRFAVDDAGVALATLDRPGSLNSLSVDTYRELRDLARALADEAAVKALVLTGANGAFCSGGNVHEVIGALVRSDGPETLAFTRLTCEVVLALRALRKPVIAAIDGVAVGGGAALALAADLRMATPGARIGFIFPRVGLSGADMGVAWLLPRIVGLGRATELLFTGEIIDAATAERWGLVNRVVPASALIDEARALAVRLAQGPTFALGITKEMLDREAVMDLPAALDAEAQAQQICMRTRDFQEAYEAFVARRPPRFQGR